MSPSGLRPYNREMQISNWELWWRQTLDLTIASMKSRYRKTFAGFLWVLLNPIIMFGVQALVFKKFLRLEMNDYYLFLAGGLIPWIFMTQTIQMGTGVLLANATLLRSFRLHPLILVASSVLDNFINFTLTLLIVVTPVILLSDSGSNWSLLWTPITLIPLLLTAASLATLMAIVNVFYRDANFVLGFVFSILFFLTPIFYPISYVPEQYHWMVELNPFLHALEPFRATLNPETSASWFPLWLKSMGWGLGIALVTLFYWRKKRNELFIAI